MLMPSTTWVRKTMMIFMMIVCSGRHHSRSLNLGSRDVSCLKKIKSCRDKSPYACRLANKPVLVGSDVISLSNCIVGPLHPLLYVYCIQVLPICFSDIAYNIDPLVINLAFKEMNLQQSMFLFTTPFQLHTAGEI